MTFRWGCGRVPSMTIRDARSLSSSAQEDLRRRVVRAVESGMSQTKAATVFGVARGTINRWMRLRVVHGVKALRAKKRGRPPAPRLSRDEVRATIRLIVGRCPDQLLLPFALWTREAVQQLLQNRCGVSVSVWTVGRYLRSWGLTPQKPLRRAFEQDPVAVRRWLRSEYPEIERRARRERAEIHWGDEMGLRSDHQAGRSYGLRGRTPVIPGTGQRFGCNMISTVTNRGKLAFMLFEEKFNAPVFLKFLARLIRHARRKVFLVVDRHPVHKSARTKRWLERHAPKIQMFFLPAYSPELNPDELLNQDVKSNAVGRHRPIDRRDMISTVRSYVRGTQRRPPIVRSYFKAPHVSYAA